MKTLHRRFGIVAVLLVVAAGCGGGDSKTTTSTSTVTTRLTATSAPTTVAASSTTVPGAIVQNVTDGAVCSPNGVRGVTSAGRAMVCGAGAAGNTQTIWRPA